MLMAYRFLVRAWMPPSTMWSWTAPTHRATARIIAGLIVLMMPVTQNASAATNWLQYIASYGDLIEAFGADAAAGERHYFQYGRAEGRALDLFNEVQYLANYPDLQATFGTDVDAATIHYITYGYLEGRTDRNLTTLEVADVASAAGLPPPTPSNGESVVFDYNADGFIDLVPSSHGQEWSLLRQGPAGKFVKVQPGTFATGQDRQGCTTADFDNDGRPDLYCVRGACKGICKTGYPKELYLQRTDRTFAKIAGAWGADDPHGRGRDAVALDFNHDGRTDLLVGNEKSTAFPTVGNHLWRNDGGRFAEVKGSPLAHTIGTFRVATVPKPDGYPDVVMRTSKGIIYYRNVKGEFQSGRLLGGSSSWDAEAADLNGDGLADLIIVRQGQIEVRLNDGVFGFGAINYRLALSQGRDVAICQLDGKPGLDIYVVQGLRPANQDIVLLNDGNGRTYRRLATPTVRKGHGDVASCVPGGYPGSLGSAVLVTNNKWISLGDPRLGPSRLMIIRPSSRPVS